MFRLQDISIRRKLTVIIMIASTVALLLVSGGFMAYELITHRQSMRRDLATLAEIIGDQSTAALTYEDSEAGQEILSALASKKHITAAALYRQGHILAQYPVHPATPGLVPAWPESETGRFEKDAYIVFHQIRLKGEPIGTLYLKSDLQEMHQRFQRYAAIVLLMMLASAIITYFLSYFLQRIISRPISHLAETAQTVSEQKNYSVRAEKHGQDELGQMIDGFNLMLDQIQQRDVALQDAQDKLEKRVEERTRDLEAEISERRRAEKALQNQFMRISLLNRITQIISERRDLESILQVVLRQLEDHFGVEFGCVGLLDEQTQRFTVAALRAKNPLLATRMDLREGMVLPFGDTSLELVRRGQTVYVSDSAERAKDVHQHLAGAGLRSVVAVPLLVENKLFGVMLSARTAPNHFSSGECEFLRMLSEHVALAGHQARLYTELQRAYNELRQTQQTVMQQERLKALGQMASGIAHDVNNALSPVVGFADLLLRGEQGLTPSGKKYLQHIATAGKDIAHIVARLREFYRRRDDQESVQEVNLNSLIEQVVDMTRPRWRDIPQSHGMTIDVQADLTPEIPPLAAIESEIREAVTNLILNAVDAMPNGGKIRLRTRLANIENPSVSPKEATHVLLEVTDSGIGMNEETLKRCLEPFFSTKGKRGTGLGLAMVYGVMERHEGKIQIESQPGKGSTFRLIFPIRKSVIADPNADAHAPKPGPRRILYIDDEPLLRELLKEVLQLDGHEVQVSDSGEAGLGAFRAARQAGKPFDIIITDLGMPYLDGRQVAAQVKRESPDTPVVLLTGWGALMREEGDLPAQVDGVLSKPPRLNELRQLLCRLPEKEKPACELIGI
jgi:signal transduction histidine kinase/ActR/RegA family two-component response regulator/HAMP domain-containing protein